jgi:hypothetical protein
MSILLIGLISFGYAWLALASIMLFLRIKKYRYLFQSICWSVLYCAQVLFIYRISSIDIFGRNTMSLVISMTIPFMIILIYYSGMIKTRYYSNSRKFILLKKPDVNL